MVRELRAVHAARVAEVGTFNGKPGVMLDVKGHGKVLIATTEEAARAWGALLFNQVHFELRVGGEQRVVVDAAPTLAAKVVATGDELQRLVTEADACGREAAAVLLEARADSFEAAAGQGDVDAQQHHDLCQRAAHFRTAAKVIRLEVPRG